ncbi:conserved hypothetical protein [Gluconacetobacter diazotrophicus PA1 5]|uniref:hypothetical protein n=1 Tax=Gluconacetobacter diazotrophicus TaxID=33996 RepID=UPI000173D6B7|nr:hypothetical protein [Gluconacetobacter diazotrophicus]ACI50311.1 conserved hypothetical protein [Gluconacetobacter diazotrophicus PA1 5]TWB08366.1 hypothetical protein FBZ86_107105 [Gluconacetobacter diazotrophicus]
MFHPSRPELFLLAVTMAGTLCLASCNLVDQRTFDPRASRAPRPHYPPPPPAPKPVPPLVEIRHGTPPDQWQPALKGAVTRAMARKPNVLFVVTVIVPAGPTPAQESAALGRATATDGQAVAAAIVADGAGPAQVEITAMSDSTMTSGVIRVYVR